MLTILNKKLKPYKNKLKSINYMRWEKDMKSKENKFKKLIYSNLHHFNYHGIQKSHNLRQISIQCKSNWSQNMSNN
jgi:hypothetical protein